jgi:hypothetical protein
VLSSTAVTESPRMLTAAAIKQQQNEKNNNKTRKMDQLRLFTLKHELLKYLYIYKRM